MKNTKLLNFLIISTYRVLTFLIIPFIFILMVFRFFKGKENKKSLFNKLGFINITKDYKNAIWFHCASVGEAKSVLPLIESFLSQNPTQKIVVTSTTQTSGKILQNELPKGAIHFFAPLDQYFFVKNFMLRLKPFMSIFVESELWPELLTQSARPQLINARISNKSYKKYKKHNIYTAFLFSKIENIYAQSEVDFNNLKNLGFKSINAGNLKFDAPVKKIDSKILDDYNSKIGEKPVIMLASTHFNEEELLIKNLIKPILKNNDVFTIIMPRHPERKDSIVKLLQEQNLSFVQMSKNEVINSKTNVILADVIGQAPLLYSLSDICIVGGSFIPHGGQNPVEPVMYGLKTFAGPYMNNFIDMVKILESKNLLDKASNDESISKVIDNIYNKVLKIIKESKNIAGKNDISQSLSEGAQVKTIELIKAIKGL